MNTTTTSTRASEKTTALLSVLGMAMLGLVVLFVAGHARGRGIGAAALALAARQARDWGAARLRLEVHHHNPRAKALYTRAGFRDDHRDMLTLDLATAG